MEGKKDDLKKIRGQIRQVAKELLPEMLNQELVMEVEKRLRKILEDRLNLIDERQKQIQGYVVRQSAK